MVIIAMILVKANMAMQMSIVDQQYSSAQAHFLTFNSPYFPARERGTDLANKGAALMVMGVMDNGYGETGGQAEASIQNLSRPGQKETGSNRAQEEPRERSKVRIRNTVAMCTMVRTVSSGSSPLPITSATLGEQSQFDFCRNIIQ